MFFLLVFPLKKRTPGRVGIREVAMDIRAHLESASESDTEKSPPSKQKRD